MDGILTMTGSGARQTGPKVLHVVISMVVGGAERLVYDMVRYPSFADNPPAVACLDARGELGKKLVCEGYSVHCKGRKPGLDWGMVSWLRDRIREERADVVHAHQYSPLFYAVPAALLAGGVKVVYTEHGRFYPEKKSWKRSLLNPLLARGVDHLVSISRATAEAMATYDNLPPNRIKVIHNGIDCAKMSSAIDRAAKRRELGLPEDCRIIGTAARLNGIKNLQMMIRVLKLVLATVPEAYLVIAGEGEEKARLKELAVRLGVVERVRFLGLRFDLPEIYRIYDVFVLSSFSEGISVTLLEAMASGLPPVATRVGGNEEVVVEGKTGFLVPVDDDALMAQRIGTLLSDRSLAQAISAAGREQVRKEFSVQQMMTAYRRLYAPGYGEEPCPALMS